MEPATLILLESLAYDEGHRRALRKHLFFLIKLAEQQAYRSGLTAQKPLAGDAEHQLHEWDIMIADALAGVSVMRTQEDV